MLFKLSHKIEKGEASKSFFVTPILLWHQNQEKIQQKGKCRPISLVSTDTKCLSKTLAKLIQNHMKRSPIVTNWLHSRDTWYIYFDIYIHDIYIYIYTINVVEHVNELRDRNNAITSIDSEKALEQNPDAFNDKGHGKVGIEGTSTWYTPNP